jgi:hypothetical protein
MTDHLKVHRDHWPDVVARAFADSAWSCSDSRITLTEDWGRISTASNPSPMFNNVRLAVLDDATADETIGALIAEYRAQGANLVWIVGPICRPRDLPARLVSLGMEPGGESWGMVLHPAVPPAPMPPGVTVRRVGLSDIDAYVSTSERGWGLPPERSVDVRSSFVRALQTHPDSLFAYLATIDDVPVGTGFMRLLDDCGVFLGSSVVPAYRGCHVYQALLTRRLMDLQRAGRQLVVVVAVAETSGPICERFGFERVCAFQDFVLPSP